MLIHRLVKGRKMGGSCNNCNHICCINGESGVGIYVRCSHCDDLLVLCSNEMTEEELDDRCNGEACGCGDKKEILCEECWNN